MNIKDLPKNSYTVVPPSTSGPLNIKNLPTSAVTPVAPLTADNVWSGLATQQPVNPRQAFTPTNLAKLPSQIKSGAESIFNTLTGAEHTVGNELISGLPESVTGEADLNKANQKNAASDTNFISAINEKRKSGQHITALQQQMYDHIVNTNPSLGTQTDLLPNAKDTNADALGAVAFLGLDALGGASFSKAGLLGEDMFKTGLQKATPAVLEAANASVDALKKAPAAVRTATQEAVAAGKIPGIAGLGDQTVTSASRLAADAPLIGGGAAREAKPLDLYNKFAAQESKHLADIKEDPAISLVGQNIGDAFEQVVKQRRSVGETLATELEKTATKPVETGPAFGNFQKELLDNGASFDAVDRELSTSRSSKFGESDKTILEKYAHALQDLGTNPTMKELDAFVSRVPQDIKALKAKQGINFGTNAERIIGNNLNELRTALNKSGTPEYSNARAAYSELSKFVKEGASHLGKVTQSGDFSKDASLAKSAVQSVLNNGKKDFLIKLEQLTGYKALDEATLALQAMKDAGDFKGNSLLELLTDGAGGMPTGAATIPQKIIGYIGKTAGNVLAGSKADQTRAFLKALGKTKK